MKIRKVSKAALVFWGTALFFIPLYGQEITCPAGSYENKQHYLEPSPTGIDAYYGWAQTEK